MGSPLARYFSPPAADGALVCGLCPRCCRIARGAAGRCAVRRNVDGEAALPYYGLVTALAEDPIEKKPLYHFRPGSSILSLGFALCNLRCPFCQNWRISQPGPAAVSGSPLSPAQALDLARERGFSQIAYTYSEPLVHIEWLLDCMALCRKADIANVLVTNGCVNAEPAAEVLALADAVNVDLKCFSEETYEKVLGGSLDAVLRFIAAAHRAATRSVATHLEITTLVVPGLNDSNAELGRCVEFIAGLSPDIPWHLSAYHPDYRYDAPPTAAASLSSIARMARERLRYVYTGNVPGERNDTVCRRCGATLVSRRGYRVDAGGLAITAGDAGTLCRCAACGEPAPIRG